jgi:hypothetical protein
MTHGGGLDIPIRPKENIYMALAILLSSSFLSFFFLFKKKINEAYGHMIVFYCFDVNFCKLFGWKIEGDTIFIFSHKQGTIYYTN